MAQSTVEFAPGADVSRRARAHVTAALRARGLSDLVDDAALVITELATNAMLHGVGPIEVDVRVGDATVRLAVHDRGPHLPVRSAGLTEAMTGRGLQLISAVARDWGVDPTPDGKWVWAELGARAPGAAAVSGPSRLELPQDRPFRDVPVFHVVLGEVPTDLLISAKAHVDNLVREFALAAQGAASGVTAAVPPHLASLIETVVHRFSEARVEIKRQALAAAANGRDHTVLELDLPASAADAGEEYLKALDEIDTYCRAARLLTLETPPQHQVFRRWYVESLTLQLRRAAAGKPPAPIETFEARLLHEIDRVAAGRRAVERTARLYRAVAALAGALTPEAVAQAVLEEGVAALRASGGGILLVGEGDRLLVPATVGYDEEVVARLRAESRDAELPAAEALRSGQPLWIESRVERDRRFPQLVGLERSTVSLCALPLQVGGRPVGALRFSFAEPRLFDADEREFVLALAAQTAQALDRARLHQHRLEISFRLQRGLLPPRLPEIPGASLAAVYRPLGEGVDIGGDFYDMWGVGEDGWMLVIGDVCGTGPEAAAVTARVRYTLRALSIDDHEPVSLLARVNKALVDLESGDSFSEGFCTVLLARVEQAPDGLLLRVASGGHPGPVVLRSDGRIEESPLLGSLLGIWPDAPMAATDVRLRSGDAVVVYTDGVIEARNGNGMFGSEGVHEVLRAGPPQPDEIAHRLELAVRAHSGGVLQDDMALLVLGVR